MTTIRVQKEIQIEATRRDIRLLKRRQLMYRYESVEWRIDEALIEINRVVLEWQKSKPWYRVK